MTHDEENDRNEVWLRRLLGGLSASNSTAESVAQSLYEFAHGGRGEIRRAAIEECIRFIQGYPRYTDAICHALRVVAQQPPAGEK